MKATVLGGVAASLLTISAFAADLGIPLAPPQTVIPPFTWTSCYAGVHAGGGEGKASGGRHPVSPWGKKEGRTRARHKESDKLIVRRRRKRGARR